MASGVVVCPPSLWVGRSRGFRGYILAYRLCCECVWLVFGTALAAGGLAPFGLFEPSPDIHSTSSSTRLDVLAGVAGPPKCGLVGQ